MKKEYIITKKCDQKDKNFKEYQFIRELEVDEEGFPLESALDNIINDESEEKSVAFFNRIDKSACRKEARVVLSVS